MEYKPFEPFKALNPGEKVIVTGKHPVYEIVALHEKCFFGANKPGWEWDIVYETISSEDNKVSYWTSRLLWTIPDNEEVEKWTSEDWLAWRDSDPDYIYCK